MLQVEDHDDPGEIRRPRGSPSAASRESGPWRAAWRAAGRRPASSGTAARPCPRRVHSAPRSAGALASGRGGRGTGATATGAAPGPERDGIGDRDGEHRRRRVAGAVGDDVADVVGAVGVARGIPPPAHDVPVAHAPTGPTRRTLEATPETASALVPETATVPLTMPPGAWSETATVAVGGVVSIVTVRPGLFAVPPARSVALMKKQNVPSPGTAKCWEVVLSGYVRTGIAAAGGVAAGARRAVDGLRDVEQVGPGRPLQEGRGDVRRGRELRRAGRRRSLLRSRSRPPRARRPGSRGWSVVPRRCSLRCHQTGWHFSRRRQPSGGLSEVPEDSPFGWSRQGPAR